MLHDRTTFFDDLDEDFFDPDPLPRIVLCVLLFPVFICAKARVSTKTMALLTYVHGLMMPVAVDDGSLSTLLGVTGVPAVVLVHDGVIAWRGHPSRFHEGRLRALTTPSDPAAAP